MLTSHDYAAVQTVALLNKKPAEKKRHCLHTADTIKLTSTYDATHVDLLW